ncbi:hypothetical protein [Lactiplantibacillus mudanjiangensis]|uniref:Uncharacterized protein n=1 Tax=Lactiplantibacillus mudanjiangensis TaxID=1296538 RepID=A0A660E9K1_9LACO|nr:hypothetical protein [Lactiplantibacillus mudanjiangensis]VDG21069.1 hypothetical protein [Lactobacillus pentosus] [Lactiplantibacillus mudanjiangensis]VDG23011.1 hypothetical protein [Lactobacillus pentosus] [Lactiplantibacillus mudanjiangensis]VDG29144.1 hypothetical protein [Lactobacillus pentosus] [Lactiplantibacillus mudanjiangensis]VDG31664.1 hypothetical protein [Lactobacillus pentosus] [Lactiplantibacillus mudanjiangensis]
MDENVLFNPGDAISESHDYNEALRSADIYNARQGRKRGILIAKPLNEDHGYSIFYADDLIPAEKAQTESQSYHVEKRYDDDDKTK